MDWSKIRGLVYKGAAAAAISGAGILYASLQNGIPQSKSEVYALGVGVSIGFIHSFKNYLEANVLPSILPEWAKSLIGIPKV